MLNKKVSDWINSLPSKILFFSDFFNENFPQHHHFICDHLCGMTSKWCVLSLLIVEIRDISNMAKNNGKKNQWDKHCIIIILGKKQTKLQSIVSYSHCGHSTVGEEGMRSSSGDCKVSWYWVVTQGFMHVFFWHHVPKYCLSAATQRGLVEYQRPWQCVCLLSTITVHCILTFPVYSFSQRTCHNVHAY